MLARGDLLAARVSAQHILQSHPESPEGHTLWGAVCTAEGDHDEAFDSFRKALDADPEHVDAMLYAAELAISSQGDTEFALQLCDEAAELVVEREDAVEIGLLRAEAHLARGEPDVAGRMLDALPSGADEPGQQLRIGRALIELDRPGEAVACLTKACELADPAADAHYLLGLAHDAAGELSAALEAFVRVHRLDQDEPAACWSLAVEQFAAAAQEALAGLPEPLGALLEHARVHLSDRPPLELVCEGVDPRAGAHVVGVPTDEPGERSAAATPRGRRELGAGSARATAVFVYQRNIERLAGSPAAVMQEIQRSLGLEAAALLGLDPMDFEPDSLASLDLPEGSRP